MEYKNLRFPIIIVSIYSVNGSELYKESSSRPKCQYQFTVFFTSPEIEPRSLETNFSNTVPNV